MCFFHTYVLAVWGKGQPIYIYIIVHSSPLRTPALKDGFKNELNLRKIAIEKIRVELETAYSVRIDDADINKAENSTHKTTCLTSVRNCDTAFNALAGSIKSVKAVVEPWLN